MQDIANQRHGDLKLLRVGAADKASRSAVKNQPVSRLKKIKGNQDNQERPRLIIFINSAIGYNEMRALS
jgi:hypothetical protein